MTKKNTLQKQINETKAKIEALRESQKPQFGLMSLMESELDKAELVLAVKGISDELQTIAEKVAKMEAEEIMPIIDSLKASFGPELAASFNKVSSENLRNLVEAIKTAKDSIGNEILRLEGAADGQQVNDMALDTPAAPEEPAMDASADLGMDDMGGDDMGGEEMPSLGMGGDAPDATDADMAIDTDEDDYIDPAAGRAKKESAEFRHANSPDKFVFEAVVSRIRGGANGPDAARLVAENLGLDLSDVVEIVSEGVTKSSKDERLANRDAREKAEACADRDAGKIKGVTKPKEKIEELSQGTVRNAMGRRQEDIRTGKSKLGKKSDAAADQTNDAYMKKSGVLEGEDCKDKFCITVKGKKMTYPDLKSAKAAADAIHKKDGIIVGIEAN